MKENMKTLIDWNYIFPVFFGLRGGGLGYKVSASGGIELQGPQRKVVKNTLVLTLVIL